jgi:hypothetical protein
VSAFDTALSLQAFVNDAFGNEVLDAPAVVVQVQGLNSLDPTAVAEHNLEGPRYSHTVTVPQDLEATLTISFSLDGVQIGEPVEIIVAPPPPDFTKVYVAAGIFAVLLLVGAVFYRRRLKHAAMRLELVELEMEGQGEAFSRQKSALEAEKEELEEEVRLKKHSEEELKVMINALESVPKERQDELKEVMLDSKELKVDRLLGKGGFGVVNLATYRGGKVAMKQLQKVNEENVLRFRHECFLMKNLAHPNVVKLVGVCWDDSLFACCLEFAENGSLEFWLRLTTGGKAFKAGPKAKSKEKLLAEKKASREQSRADEKAAFDAKVVGGWNPEVSEHPPITALAPELTHTLSLLGRQPRFPAHRRGRRTRELDEADDRRSSGCVRFPR